MFRKALDVLDSEYDGPLADALPGLVENAADRLGESGDFAGLDGLSEVIQEARRNAWEHHVLTGADSAAIEALWEDTSALLAQAGSEPKLLLTLACRALVAAQRTGDAEALAAMPKLAAWLAALCRE